MFPEGSKLPPFRVSPPEDIVGAVGFYVLAIKPSGDDVRLQGRCGKGNRKRTAMGAFDGQILRLERRLLRGFPWNPWPFNHEYSVFGGFRVGIT